MGAGSHSIRRHSVPEAVASSLRTRILNGEFRDGDQLRQEAIAAEYDVSRMPVREALRQLEAEGLVQLLTHRGAIVTSLSPAEVGDLFSLRMLIEPDVLRQAIPRMAPSDFAASEDVLRRLEAAYRDHDIPAWGALNWEYHRSLYAPAGRAQTLAVLQTVNNQTDRYVRLQLLVTGELGKAELEHRALLELCREGDHARAGAFLRQHIADARDALIPSLG